MTVSRRCASAGSVAAAIAFARSTVPTRVREESASSKRPGHGAIGCKFVLKARQLLKAEFEHGKLIEMAVHGRDEVDEAQRGEGSACPAIVNTSRATTIAVARFGTRRRLPRRRHATAVGPGCEGRVEAGDHALRDRRAIAVRL